MVLSHLLYISDATQPITSEDLEAIRNVSVQNNAKLAITGVLFYSAGHFVQLLEGDAGDINDLFEKIASDRRHHNVRLLTLRPAEQRIFEDWNMGLLDLSGGSSEKCKDLDELVRLARLGDDQVFGTPIELEILSRFCMLLPAA